MLASYEWVESQGHKGVGKAELLRLMNGEPVTIGDMVKAMCYQCMGYYIDGTCDCDVRDCPLYQRMPYRKGGIVKRPSRGGAKASVKHAVGP